MCTGYDERDTIFSRMLELKEGTARYDEYYARRRDLELPDRRLRDASGGVFADRLPEQAQISALFSLIGDLRPLAGHGGWSEVPDGQPGSAEEKLVIDSAEASMRIRKIATSLGAFSCGITRTNAEWVYSVRGRGPHYGERVENVLPNTVVFAVEMDEAEINRAPAVEESAEVAKSYLLAAAAGLAVRRIIGSWGYRAVCHMDGESQLVLPPAAVAAGLGSIGLHGVLITKECGPRIRLAAVTTDMPLEPDKPSGFSAAGFCRTCGRCADTCPSVSIRKFTEYKKGERFSINHETCFGTWRDTATDCGVCLAVCPFSHPNRNDKNGSEKAGSIGFLKDFMFGRRP